MAARTTRGPTCDRWADAVRTALSRDVMADDRMLRACVATVDMRGAMVTVECVVGGVEWSDQH
jgi:hypothetical protein